MEGGFSIREYALGMRSINVAKSWPFDETTDGETVNSLLPPITVAKFTWWLDELECTHPESALNFANKKKNKLQKGETFSPKAKLKAPKKRSIIEIFAVAPPVERVMSEEDEDEEEENDENSLEGRKKKTKMKNLRVVRKIKKTKIAQKHENKTDRSVPNKENSNKLTLQVQEKATGNSSSSHSKRKPSLQHRDAYNKKPVPCDAFDQLIEEDRRPGFPVRGILKNNGDAFPVQQSMKCILQEAIPMDHCSTKMANKHVTFSEKDDTIGCDDASIGVEKEVGGGPARNEHLTTCIVNEEEHSRIPEASETSLLYHGNQDCPRFFTMPLDGYYNSPNIEMIRTSSNSTYRRPRLHFEEYMRTYNEPPVAHLLDMEKRNHTFSESKAINNVPHSFQFQSLPHFSPKNFVGLPLNSQGELIRSNSRDVNQMMNPSTSLSLPRNAVSSCYSHHSDLGMNQLNLFPVESYAKENPVTVIPSRLGIVESQNERNTNLDFLEANYRSFHDSDNIMWRGDEHVHRIPENEKIQSTMRLMGKEFTVGGSVLQGTEDGHIWKDKQIIDQNEPSSGKFRETLFFPSDGQYTLPQFDHRPGPMYPSVFVARKTDPPQKFYPGTFYNNEAFSEPFTSGYGSRLFTVEVPTPTVSHQEAYTSTAAYQEAYTSTAAYQEAYTSTAAYQEAYPYVIPTAKNNQNRPHAPISAIRFPFLHPDLDERSISPWSQRSVKQHFDVKEKEILLSSSQSCNLGHNHPYLNPGTSHGTDSSERDDFRVFFPMSSVSASQKSVVPSSLPYYPGILMQKHHRNQKKFKERTKIRIGKGSKSQLSALSTVPFKHFKMPTLGSHEYTQCAIRKPTYRANFADSDAFGSYPAMDKSRFVMCGEYEADKDERTISRWMDSHADTGRAGPVKLTGGAKHILKAYKQKDQSSSASIDQEISLPASNMDFRFPESENSAKIYRKTPVFDL